LALRAYLQDAVAVPFAGITDNGAGGFGDPLARQGHYGGPLPWRRA
jgi:hypothetical protein